MKKKLLYIFLIFLTVLLIISPEKTIFYSSCALDLCESVIIPSLFPFFVCSGLLIHSGFCEILAKFLEPVMKPLFNINGSGAAAFVLGIISGYPLGAVTACQLYEKNYLTKTEAERLLTFCNNSGPLFILGAVGISLYHSPKVGVILYSAHIISALLTGFFFRFYKKNDFTPTTSHPTVAEKPFAEIFSSVLSNSIQSILTVCGAVLFFSAVSGIIINLLPLSDSIRSIVMGFMEFASGTKYISESTLPLFEKLIISSAVVGFAGLSVHIQVLSVVSRHGLGIFPYIFGKAVQSIISAVTAFCLLKFMPNSISVFSSQSVEISGAFAMNSLYIILAVASALFVILSGAVFMFFKTSRN